MSNHGTMIKLVIFTVNVISMIAITTNCLLNIIKNAYYAKTQLFSNLAPKQ